MLWNFSIWRKTFSLATLLKINGSNISNPSFPQSLNTVTNFRINSLVSALVFHNSTRLKVFVSISFANHEKKSNFNEYLISKFSFLDIHIYVNDCLFFVCFIFVVILTLTNYHGTRKYNSRTVHPAVLKLISLWNFNFFEK